MTLNYLKKIIRGLITDVLIGSFEGNFLNFHRATFSCFETQSDYFEIEDYRLSNFH